jgi:CreA protein
MTKKSFFKWVAILFTVGMLFVFVAFAQAEDLKAVQIGEVTCIKRLVQGNDLIKIIRVQDPENPFVSIFFTTVKTGKVFAMADPSNTSIAARLTGMIPVDTDGKRIINVTPNVDIAHIRKSIGSKVMKIARFYDIQMDTLTYLVYTTKLLDGSLKHSLSVVPLGMSLTPKRE